MEFEIMRYRNIQQADRNAGLKFNEKLENEAIDERVKCMNRIQGPNIC